MDSSRILLGEGILLLGFLSLTLTRQYQAYGLSIGIYSTGVSQESWGCAFLITLVTNSQVGWKAGCSVKSFITARRDISVKVNMVHCE